MMQYNFIATLDGQAAIANAIATGNPISLTSMVVGDGNGSPVTPVETMAGLVGPKHTVALASVVQTGVQVDVTGILPQNVGGWTIRELGILDDNGVMLFVGSYPDTYKTTTSETGGDELHIIASLVVSDTAQVTIVVNGSSYATQDYVNEAVTTHRTHLGTPLRPYFIAVDSVVQASPPDAPAIGATYLVPENASGAWAAQVGKLAQFRGTAGWIYIAAPAGHQITDGTTGIPWMRTGSGWRSVFAAMDEHLAGTSEKLQTHPKGVKAMIDAAVAPTLFSDMFFLGSM